MLTKGLDLNEVRK
jgi:hypothetical protein